MSHRISDIDLERLATVLATHARTPGRVSLKIAVASAIVKELIARRDEEFRRAVCETADLLAEEAVPMPTRKNSTRKTGGRR